MFLRAATLAGLLAFAPSQEVEHQAFDSGGVPIHFTLQGDGETPLVLLHGYAGSQEVMGPMIRGLTGEHWVIAMDVRGHGRSGKPHEPERYGLELVEDVVRLLDFLGVEKAHVLGYSMGALITLKLVTTHPERVLSAVAGGYGWAEFQPVGEDIMDRVADSLERGEGFGPLFGKLAEDAESSKETLAAIEKALLAANDPLALAAAARGFRHLALAEQDLRANQVPVLAIIGERDPLKKDVDRLAGAMSNLEVVVIEGADHGTAGLSPQFLANVKRFLAAHAPEAALQPAGR